MNTDQFDEHTGLIGSYQQLMNLVQMQLPAWKADVPDLLNSGRLSYN